MSCKHDNDINVLGSSLVEVSDEGMTVLFELQECDECKGRWLVPYIEIPEIDPIPEGFKVEVEEDEKGVAEVRVTPTDEYVRKVLGVGKHTRITVL